MRVPADQIEIYIANGWRLGDEPGCGAVMMIPPAVFSCVNSIDLHTPSGGNEKPRGDR
jgi:hypothetical protein